MPSRTMLMSKLHRVTTTQAELHYEGSCAIDEDLLAAANIREHQQIDIYNVSNGQRFTTYAIRAEAGSGTVSVNGAAARLVSVGDRLILASYSTLDDEQCAEHHPKVVLIGEDNRIKSTKDHESPGVRFAS